MKNIIRQYLAPYGVEISSDPRIMITHKAVKILMEHIKTKTEKKRAERASSHESAPPPPSDMLAFYRNLLRLKIRFTGDELKDAYRKAAAKYHPDHYGKASPQERENAEILMKQVNEAYVFLKKQC